MGKQVGNSLGVRIKHDLILEHGLKLGDVVMVSVVPSKPMVKASRKQKDSQIVSMFNELHRIGAFSEIGDPVAWQREIRKDRPMPGRD